MGSQDQAFDQSSKNVSRLIASHSFHQRDLPSVWILFIAITMPNQVPSGQMKYSEQTQKSGQIMHSGQTTKDGNPSGQMKYSGQTMKSGQMMHSGQTKNVKQ